MPSDFTDILEAGVVLVEVLDSTDIDFVESGDQTSIIVTGGGWGDEPWGDEGWGGDDEVIVISSPTTVWTGIGTP